MPNSSMWAMLPDNTVPVLLSKDMTLIVAAGAYTVFTSVGGVVCEYVLFYSGVAAATLTSFHVDTDDTTAIALLGSTAAATASGGKNLTPYTTAPFFLPDGKHIVLTTVGGSAGTAGDLRVSVRYLPTPGGYLS